MLKIFVTMGLKRLIDSVAEVFYPRLCPVCGERLVAGERSVCLSCLAVMPRVGIAQGGCPDVERMLLGSRLVERAVSMFEYHRASPYAEPTVSTPPSMRRRTVALPSSTFRISSA